MADVLDILDIERPASPQEVTKESILAQKVKKPIVKREVIKKPEGMARELFNLLYTDNKDAPPLFPTEPQGYKQVKAKLGVRKVRQWKWTPFVNPARKDGAVLHHWRRVTDEPKEYPFAKFNKQVNIFCYTESEYQQYLQCDSWTRPETDHLLDLARRFDLRFHLMFDRWDRTKYPNRSVEDLKERYYEIVNCVAKTRHVTGPEPKTIVFDGDHEKRRKEQLRRLYDRTQDQIEEEQSLLNELKKIEARKKDREKKTQDLQKLITAAVADEASTSAKTPLSTEKKSSSQQKKKVTQTPSTASKTKLDTSALLDTPTGIKFPDFKTSGVFVRSQRMKLPPSVGQKKSKAIEQMLSELGLEQNPIPTEEICTQFNDLRSDLVFLYELKVGLATCEYEIQSLRHQYEVLVPGKTLEIPAGLALDTVVPEASEESKPKTISEVLDVLGSATTPSRKRKAALEQSNIMKKIKNRT
uniref:DNA methyltransferase 1-associated protein 1 n=1 Tax=Lynceus sp. MCZ IZ 141354 TaxID=1930659 RepID=A0A9N6ZEK8_9CRUS|nr:EOG090X076S [Lynceus sp. MCZ IZ 141354]